MLASATSQELNPLNPGGIMYRVELIARRKLVTMGALFLLISVLSFAQAAHAQDCHFIGNQTFCDNGLFGQRLGNTAYWSDGTSSQRSGNFTYNSDGTSSQRIGNHTYNSDGSSSQTIGNFTYFGDGTSCQRIGNHVYCR